MGAHDIGWLYAVPLWGVLYVLMLYYILLDKNNVMDENVFSSKGIIHAKELMF
jgi:hypothetical protein